MSYDIDVPDEPDVCEACLAGDGVRWYTGVQPHAWVCGVCALFEPRDILFALREAHT